MIGSYPIVDKRNSTVQGKITSDSGQLDKFDTHTRMQITSSLLRLRITIPKTSFILIRPVCRESVIQDNDRHQPAAVMMIIKSTVPVGGFTAAMRQKFATRNIIFSPGFYVKVKPLRQPLFPPRIVIGERSERARGICRITFRGKALLNGIPTRCLRTPARRKLLNFCQYLSRYAGSRLFTMN